jgi:hypothetical protein
MMPFIGKLLYISVLIYLVYIQIKMEKRDELNGEA